MVLSFPNRRALIVDDEYLVAFELEESVRDLGFKMCDVAPSAMQAKALAMENPPDLVLMDVYLDGARSGIEAGRWLRDFCNASVIFVTAHNDRDTLERIREAMPGAPILPKSVYRERLAEAISQVIH